MGAFAHYFNIRPWEWDLLGYADTVQLMAEIDALTAQAKN